MNLAEKTMNRIRLIGFSSKVLFPVITDTSQTSMQYQQFHWHQRFLKAGK